MTVDHLCHDSSGDWGQKDAVAKVTGGDKDMPISVGPRMGKSSGVPGRSPAQLWVIGADASAGTYFAAVFRNR